MSLTFPTTTLKKPSGLTAIPSGFKRPAFGTLYGFDAQVESSGFNIDVRDTHSNIIARTGDPVGTIAFGTDTYDLYVYDGALWVWYDYDSTTAWPNEYSVDFDGANDYVINSSLSSELTVEAISLWFKPDLAYQHGGSKAYLLGFGGSDEGIALAGDYYGPITNELITVANNNHLWSYTSTDALSTSTWYHLAIRWESSSSSTNSGNAGYDIFLNGTKVGNAFGTYTSGNGSQISADAIVVGARYRSSTPAWYFNGYVDEVAIFDSAISEADITAIYNSGVPADLSSLSPVGWWRMGDGTGDTDSGGGAPASGDTIGTVVDQGSGGNNATGANGALYSSTTP